MFSNRKWYWKIFPILALMTLLLACELPAVIVDLLREASGYTKERCEANGGYWYYDEESERWWCADDIFDTKPNEAPLDDSEAPVLPVFPAEEEVNLSDLAGTYIGTTNFLDHRVENWGGGAITQNEITITISEDGVVGGTFSVRFESSQKSNESCAWQSLPTDSGAITGQISQSGETIKFDYTSTLELVRKDISGDCALDENEKTVFDHHDEFFITISGNTMIGSGDGTKTFEATKQ